MTGQCIEIVTYKVSNPDEADYQRDGAQERAARLPGFSGWLALSGCKYRGMRTDLVIWENAQSAEAAAEVVGKGKDFSGFRASITEFGGIGHYAPPRGGLALLQPGSGIEIGQFRPRPGVNEADLRMAHDRMIADHLCRQPGWRGQRLIRLQDGTYMDIAFAGTQAQAQAICASWTGIPACEAFLALIEPISMEFGSIL